MLDGLEWNVRLSQIDNAPILSKFRTVFEQYWNDPTFEPYDPARDPEDFDHAAVPRPVTRPAPRQSEFLSYRMSRWRPTRALATTVAKVRGAT
jgi:hypothetical protein